MSQSSPQSCVRVAEVEGTIAVVTMDSPPVNALGYAVRQGLYTALNSCLGKPHIQAIVIVGQGKGFSAGK